MIPLALGVLRVAWPYILGAIILGGVYYKAQHWCNSVCKDARAEVEQLQAEKKQAQERATALAGLWAAQVDKTEAATRQRREVNAATFAVLSQRARSLPAGGALSVSAGAARLFGDVADRANAAAPAPGSQTSAAAIPEAPGAVSYSEREFSEWVVKAGESYADAVNQWRACVNHYESIAQIQGTQ